MAVAAKNLRWDRFLPARSPVPDRAGERLRLLSRDEPARERDERRALIVPVDHGLTIGPVPGLGSVREIAGWIGHPAINGVVAHKGLAARLAENGLLTGRGLMVHLNGMTATGEEPDTKHVLTRVESAVRLAADAVSLQVNFGPDNHAHNLTALGRVVDEAEHYALPVMAMVYPAGPAADPDENPDARLRRHRHYLRIAFELGVDVVKTSAPESLADVPALLDGVGDDLRVLFSGGALTGDAHLLDLAKTVATSNAAGLCVGRNVFQRDEPGVMLSLLRELLDG
jgi:class I fructose-bisphosphate aldolase/fructose-bisphosphate aldolase/2-amino-3,7-dideoxy-D-threo-hept-6-ulosonate synthase